MVTWDGNIVACFPTDNVILWCDPDTVRENEVDPGEAIASIWKWTGLSADCGVYANGDGDNGYLILNDDANTRFVRNTTNAYDVAFDTTETAISITFETKDYSRGAPGLIKASKRILLDISRSGDWTVTFSSDGRTAGLTLSSSTGTTHYRGDIALPYTMDGYLFGVKLENSTTNAVEIYGFSDEAEGRPF